MAIDATSWSLALNQAAESARGDYLFLLNGELLPEPEVRAMMLLRANVLAKGYSGARPELAELLLSLLNLELMTTR